MDISLLLQAAAQAAAGQQYPAPALYVVGTPIGNLADLSLRALHVLALVDAVACEDTRVSAGLLGHFGLKKPLITLHRHNESTAAAQLLERLQRGERVAYVSDAGTPAISDPGALLVSEIAAAGHRVLPIPGASSVAAAMSVAGDAHSAGFRFTGFLPAKGAERREALALALADPAAVVLFEAPHRIEALAAAVAESAPHRRVTVCRELTKQFESIETLRADAWPAWLAADPTRHRGEFVLVLHAPRAPANGAAAESLPQAVLDTLTILMRELPLKQAVALSAEITGAARNALYEEALARRG